SKAGRLGFRHRQTTSQSSRTSRKLTGFNRGLIGGICVGRPTAFGFWMRRFEKVIIGGGVAAVVNRAWLAIALEIVRVLGYGLAILTHSPRFVIIRVWEVDFFAVAVHHVVLCNGVLDDPAFSCQWRRRQEPLDFPLELAAVAPLRTGDG